MVFSKLLVANVDVVPGQGSVLKQGLDDTKELVLSHRENIFTIQFAALDYSAPSEYSMLISWKVLKRPGTM